MTEHIGCAEQVYHTITFHFRPCSRRGVIEHEGRWYCRQHGPAAVGERRAKRRAEANARNQKWIAGRNRRYAEQSACTGLSTEALESGIVAATFASHARLETVCRAVLQLDEPVTVDLGGFHAEYIRLIPDLKAALKATPAKEKTDDHA